MLRGRHILVTGGSSGIGRELVRRYAGQGATVISVGRRREGLDETAQGLTLSPVSVAADIVTEDGRTEVAAAATDRLDVVVHAAGALGPTVPLAEYPEQDWNEVFAVNVTAVHLLHQTLLPHLSPTATIIGVSSSVGRLGRGGWGMYAVSKAALEGWLEVLADEWTGKVFSVNPGGTATPMRAAAQPDEDPATIPTPADIAPIFLRLAHPACREPTGAKFNARDWIGRDPWVDLERATSGPVD